MYDAVLAAMSTGVMQLHVAPLTEGPIAIVDRTESDRLGEAATVRARLEKTLRGTSLDTINGYFRVREERRTLERRFNLRLPYEFVSGETANESEAERFRGGVVRLSPVGFSRSGREALMFVSHYCGPLCATGHFVLLRADHNGWRVERAMLMVIS